MKKGYLILQDGQVFEGVRFGAETDTVGELVFTTGMCGYVETLTDPSYAGQIVMQTYPLIGNYGIIREDFEGACCVKGYVVREYCDTPSNFRTDCDLDTYLKEQGVPGLCGVDTRELTRIIREHGVMNAAICDEIPADLTPIKTYAITGVVEAVSCKEPDRYPAEGEECFRVSLIDYGAKRNIARELCKRGCAVTVLPCSAKAKDILAAGYDGVMLSNGPGDPDAVVETYEQVQQLIGKVPVFGICLGHQMISLACGAQMEKLKFGHRGGNQPVMNLVSRRVEITAQNHGFGLLFPSLGKLVPELSGGETEHAADGDLRVWVRRGIAPVVMNERFGRIRLTHVNLNDGTAEGIQLLDAPCFSVQYHPEASPGPTDAHYLFTAFTRLMDGEENYLDIDTAKDRLQGWNFAENGSAATETEEN